MQETIKSADIATEFVVLGADKRTTTVMLSPTVYNELEWDYNGFKGCELISAFEFEAGTGQAGRCTPTAMKP